MSAPINRVSEKDVSIAVLRVLANTPIGQAPISYLVRNARKFLDLSEADLAPSITRPQEAVWEQIVRNIVCHRNSNFVSEGYFERIPNGLKIADKGRTYLKDYLNG